tara:strand:+ start:459 stop:719 length:261 start_codon:yes stop_codon:yes gene_type:complete
MIFKAIKKINPNAEVVIRGSDIDTCEIEFHNGTAEISKADIKAMIPTVEQELKDAEANAITKKASGKQKLKDLGLTDAEIKALIGV